MKKHSDNLKKLASQFLSESVQSNYSYNFEWLSRPIIQYPQDIVATQEIIWKVKPDLIIETGIAHGGSLVLSASILALLDYCDALESGTILDPKSPNRKVIGVDIDIRILHAKRFNKTSDQFSNYDQYGFSPPCTLRADVSRRGNCLRKVPIFDGILCD